MARKPKKSPYVVLKEISAKQESLGGALSNGRAIFEQILSNYKQRNIKSLLSSVQYEADQTRHSDIILYEVAILEGMISYYHKYYVSDDDLDAIRDVMSKAYEDIEVYADDDEIGLLHFAYIRACMCLEMRYVVFDEDWSYAVKSMAEVVDVTLRTGRWGRDWEQVQYVPDYVYSYHELIPDDNSRDGVRCYEEKELHERLVAALSTLNERERQVIDFRFGILDGYSRTLKETGCLLNCTRECVRQIEARALRRLRFRVVE